MSDRLSEYEEARLRTMASNEAFLASLELAPLSTSPPRTSARAGQRKPRASGVSHYNCTLESGCLVCSSPPPTQPAGGPQPVWASKSVEANKHLSTRVPIPSVRPRSLAR